MAKHTQPKSAKVPVETDNISSSIIQLAHDAIMVVDKDQNIILFNQGAEKIFGYKASEVIGQRLDLLLPPHVSDLHRAYDRSFNKAPVTARLMGERQEISGRRKNGVIFPAEASISKVSVSGKIVFIAFFRDITERKEAEDALGESEGIHRLVLDNVDEIVYLVEMGADNMFTNQVRFVSGQVEQILGYQAEEFIHDRDLWFSNIHPDDVPALAESTRAIFASRQPGLREYRMRHKRTGDYHWLEDHVVPQLDAAGVVIGQFGVARDVTEQRKAEAALREREEYLANLMDTVGDAIFTIRMPERRIEYVNRALTDMFGYLPEEVIGQTTQIFYLDDAGFANYGQRLYDALARGQRQMRGELELRRKDGERLWAEVHTTFLAQDGQPLRVISMVRDTTKRKQAELELQHRKEDLELINTLNELVNRGESLEKLIDTLSIETRRIYSAHACSVFLLNPDGKVLTIPHLTISPSIIEKIEQTIGQPMPPLQIPFKESGHIQKRLKAEQGVITSDPKLIQQWMMEFAESTSISPVLRGLIRKLVPQIFKFLNIGSTLTVPLISDNKTIGLLELGNAGLYTTDDLTRVRNISGQVTAAILRKQDEESLAASEAERAQLLNVLEFSLNEIYIFDAETLHFQYINQGALRNLGYTREAMRAMSPLDIMSEFNQDSFRKLVDPLLRHEKELVVFHTVHRRADDSLYPVEVHLQMSNFEGKRVFHAIILDITERKRAEEALRKSEEKYRSLVDTMNEGLGVQDKNGLITFMNKRGCEMLGYELEELIGKPVTLVFDEENQKILREQMTRRIEGERQSYEIAWLRKDGTRIDTIIAPSPRFDEKGDYVGSVAVITDITERKRANQALQESQKMYREVVENASDIIYSTDRNGKFTYANPAALRVVGYSLEELRKLSYLDLILPDYRRKVQTTYFRQFLGKLPSPYVEFPFQTNSGEVRWFGQNASPVLDGQSTVGFQVIARDITERKHAEQRLATQYAVARALAESSTLAEAAPRLLEAICESLDWDHAEVWSILWSANSQANVLRCTGTWHPLSLSFPEFETATRQIEFPPGVGLPGRVWASGEPAWIPDVIQDANFPRAPIAAKEGLHAGFAFPIQLGSQVLGVMGFLSREIRPPDNDTLQMLTSVSSQISYFIRGEQGKEALRESEERYRVIAEAASDVILVIGEDSRITFVNPAGENLFGYASDEIIGQSITLLMPEDLRPLHQEAFKLYLNTGERRLDWKAVELHGRHKSGREFPIEVSFGEFVRDGKHAFAGIVRDITERKQAEESLKKLSSVVEQTADNVFITDREGIIKYINPAFEQLTGYSKEEAIGKTPRILKSGKHTPAEYEHLWKTILAGKVLQGVVINRKKDGDLFYDEKTISPLRDGQGNITHFVSTGRDITERKRAEEELERRAEQFALLYDAGLALNSVLEPRMQLEFLFKIAVKALHADRAEFFRYDRARDVLRFEQDIGYDEKGEAGQALRAQSFRNGDERGLVGWVSKNRVPLNVPDVSADPRYVAIDPEIRSGLWMPVVHENRLGGVLAVLSTRINVFTPHDERLLALFANQVAVGLENARLFEETRQRLTRIQSLRNIDMAISGSTDLRVTFNVALDEIVNQLGIDAACILRLDSHTQTLEYAAGRGFRTHAIEKSPVRLGEGHAGRAAFERRSVSIADLPATGAEFVRAGLLSDEGFKTYHAIPLIAKGQVLGVLEVFHRAAFEGNGEWLDFLETLAGQTAIAMDNASLFQGLERSNINLLQAYDATIEGWSQAMDLRDKETEGHTQRVTKLTEQLARTIGMSHEEIVHARRGALLHDIGKIGVPDPILLKADKLTDEEWGIMKSHPQFAYNMLSPIAYLKPALDIPYCHHEKWDGTGYPRGLKGEQIPLAARLFAMADVYDALTSDRPYRREVWSKEKTLEHIREQSGKHFDPQLVEVFMMVAGGFEERQQ